MDAAEDELAELVEEFPIVASLMPLPYFAALLRASDAAIERATDMALEPAEVQASPYVRPAEAAVPEECGALKEWQRQVSAGQRKEVTVDPLARAGMYEAAARDELRQGMRKAACQSRLKAAAIIVELAGERAA